MSNPDAQIEPKNCRRPLLQVTNWLSSCQMRSTYIPWLLSGPGADWPCSAFHEKIAKLKPTDQDTKPNTIWVGILKHNKKPGDHLVQTDCLWAKCGKVSWSSPQQDINRPLRALLMWQTSINSPRRPKTSRRSVKPTSQSKCQMSQ